MLKNTFSFCLLFAFSLIVVSGFFVESKAQESDFLIDDGVSIDEDKSAEYLIPDSPFTDEKESSKRKTNEESKKIKEVQDAKSPEQPVVPPAKESFLSNETAQQQLELAKPTSPGADEENPLSFNFLYYIIHKFKFSDVADH